MFPIKKNLLAKLLVSLASVRAKRGMAWSQALLAEIVESGDKNSYVSQHHVLFCEESLGKIDAELLSFSGTGRSTNSIGSLESVDNFGTSECFSENFDGEAINWSGVENFHCMKMSLVMSMRFIFGDD